MDSSSKLEPYEDLPTQESITTTSTSSPFSSSSSASPPKLKGTYDVFLSFRGEDTRNNFVDHLFTNLTQKGINTFRDEKLERGKEISGDLLKAIKESRFAIIIFSENYASSSWCLDELVKIIDCTKETGQIAYPVFYNVDPSNVRNQKGSFAEAFDKDKNLALEKMKKWKDALSQAGRLSGWDTRGRPEAEIVQKIVEEIFYKLSRGLLDVDDNLVGMEVRMEEISTLLNLGSNDVKFVGIHGLGGIGKTTTAKVIYNQIYKQFEGCSYLANVRGRYEMERNLVSLQKQLLCEILKVQDLQIFDDNGGSSVIKNRLNNKKVLIILDDVDDENQLKKLAGNGNWFGPGSRIIITTRDQHLLSSTYEGVQKYEVKECDQDKSREIFSWKAFKQNHPPEDYMELSNEVVHYAKGLPLALTVLGSHLCGRSKNEWEGAIEELKIVPDEKITKILKISYDGLTLIQKNVFLDIACFFNGENRDEVMEKLHSFGFFPSKNIPVLIDKSLITVSAKNELTMHDLVRDMGQHIVREKSPQNPEKWSRLWNTEDILQVLEKNMGSKAIEGIQLSPPTIINDFKAQVFKAQVFKKMKNLRFLSYFGLYQRFLGSFEQVKQFPERLSSFSDKLKILEWEDYPCEHLALDFPHHKLVHLSLTYNSLNSLWNGKQVLPQLKSIDLSHSRHLREFPDVSGLPNLERLSLHECKELVEIHPSIWVHTGLKFLDLTWCSNLESFPNKIEMESLETLNLGRCEKMERLSETLYLPHLKSIDVSQCKRLREFPDVSGLPNLERLSLDGCEELVEIHPSVWVHNGLKFLDLLWCSKLGSFPNKIEMESLETLDLGGCTKMEEFPEVHENMKRLSRLHLSDTAIKELPSSIENFTALKTLDLIACRNLVCLPSIICKLKYLELLSLQFCNELVEIDPSVWVHRSLKFLSLHGCSDLGSFPNKIEMESLETLDLSECEKMEEFPEVHENMKCLSILYLYGTKIKELPSSIENFTALKSLSLRSCKNFVWLPSSICKLKYLEELYLIGCSALEILPENLGELESLVELDASETAIKEAPASIQFLDKLRYLSFGHCSGLKLPSFNGLPSSLTKLDLRSCDLTDETFPSNIECLSLEELDLSGNNFVSLPANITQLSLLTRLGLSYCKRIESITSFYGLPSSLTYLDLGYCDLTDETFPSNIECLSSLETLDLRGNNFVSLPANITQLPRLTKLDLRNCKRIKSIPELSSRISIYTSGCTSLTSVSTPNI